jgi:hypothetical protein
VSPDDDLARLVEDWLASEARPLPDHVRDAVIDALPEKRRARPPLVGIPGRWRRALDLAAIAAVVAVIAVAAPALIDRARWFVDGPAGSGLHPRPTASTDNTCSKPAFAPPIRIDTSATGNGPLDVVTGDFNSDGAADFVLANQMYVDARIAVVLGRGDGTFGVPTGLPSGGISSFATTDVDRDSVVDLVGVNPRHGSLVVLRGDGTGGFREPTESQTGDSPHSLVSGGLGDDHVVVGRFDEDAIDDVAVTGYASLSIAIMLGDGQGGFGQPTQVPTAGRPSSIAAADFNGDGNADLAVALAEDGQLEVFLGDGNGGLGAGRVIEARSEPTVSAADLNGDGRPDLIATNHGDAGLSTYIGDGLGGFQAPTFIEIGGNRGENRVVVADFDGDGDNDIAAAADGRDSSVIILAGDGTGAFVVTDEIVAGDGPLGIAAADFDLDGALDLVTADVNTVSGSVLLNACGRR